MVQRARKKMLSVDELVDGVSRGDRAVLARAITLVESNALHHFKQGQEVLTKVLPRTGNAVRVGITGIPGAGKSTFIEALGMHLINQNKKVAVLAIDPSSSITGGSILGDKTRMVQLTQSENAFIRPSPSAGAFGGVARRTHESMLLCEAAGFDVILIETIGVGQSEIMVRSMVDFFLLLQIAGGGDELQGIKKGVMELADAILINKADGENKNRALQTKQDTTMALHYLQPATPGWHTKAHIGSALTGVGIPEFWQVVEVFVAATQASGYFSERRDVQAKEWLQWLLRDQINELITGSPSISHLQKTIESQVINGEKTAATGARELLETFLEACKKGNQSIE